MRIYTEHIYHQKVNQVIDYIHAHLDTSLSLDTIANHIHVSQRQLLRIMRLFLNESLIAYIARQRMERAVMYMQTESMSLTTLSEKVGYDNPQSFSKAFKKQFGIPPKAYMKELEMKLHGYVQSSGNRLNNLSAEICMIQALELVYIRILGDYGEEEAYNMAWNKLVMFLKEQNALSGTTRFIGISFDDPHITQDFPYRFYACTSVEKKIIPTCEFGCIQIKKGKYAVYTLKGSYSGLQELYNHISVNLDYPIRYGIAFEEYLNSPHNTEEKDLLTKVYIPIKE